MSDLRETLSAAYSFDAPSIEIGHATHGADIFPDLPVRLPVAMFNRHGLIAGSTGTGKTRTLQLLAESLSRVGVPSFISDIKGDVSGMAMPGVASDKLNARLARVGKTFEPAAVPAEFFSLTGVNGTQIRATVSSFGPMLLGKVLDLTDVQQSVLAMVFKYCDDRKMPLLDFHDLKEVLHYLGGPGKADLKQYGGMSTATVGVLIRKMIELEQQGAERFFGEPELDIKDLMRVDANGHGIVNILSLADVQDRPRLYSTFLMWLLGQFYYDLPEAGDLDKPKLVFFFDEAHLLFDDASSALVEHIEQVARLIRSKGIGVFFVTQTPKDVSEEVLAQLGNRVQHAVRAFTPKDARNLKATATTFPKTEFYDLEESLTNMGIGEALVTVLNPKGIPTPVCTAQIGAPRSYMGQLTPEQYAAHIAASTIRPKYVQAIDRESAREILQKKLDDASAATFEDEAPLRPSRPVPPRSMPQPREYEGSRGATRRTSRRSSGGGIFDSPIAKTAARQAARTVAQQVVRGIFGMLKR